MSNVLCAGFAYQREIVSDIYYIHDEGFLAEGSEYRCCRRSRVC